MKLYNPFMPWLNPRNSGLIAFKGGDDGATAEEVETIVDNTIGTSSGTVDAPGGTMDIPTTSVDPETGEVTTGTNTVNFGGDTVAVTDTVKGDTETLIGGQSDISDQITTGFETFQPVNVTNTTIDTSDLAKADEMDQGFTSVLDDTGAILDDTGAIKTGVEGLGTDVSAIKDDTGAIKTGVEGLGTSIDEGFATTGDQLTGLGTGQTGISNQISDLSGDVSEGITTVGNNLTSGFENIDNQFASQNEDLATLSTNVLGGQASLQDYLNDMSGRADTYYEGLSGNQSQLLENLGGLQTGFTDFRDTYDSDVTLANQTRADLQDTVVGGFNRMREDMGNNFESTQKNVNRVADQVEANQAQQALAARTPNLSLTQSIKELASGVQATTPTQADAQNQVASKLATIKQILMQSGQNIPENIRSDYTALANAFDQKGRFIPQSIDQQGNVTSRVMDEQTNLRTSIVNSRGVSLGGKNINVANLLSFLDGRPQGSSPMSPELANKTQLLQGLMSQQTPFNTTQG
jgi:hypothetical protein